MESHFNSVVAQFKAYGFNSSFPNNKRVQLCLFQQNTEIETQSLCAPLHFFFMQTFSSYLRFALQGGGEAFCHRPKETGGREAQVSSLSVGSTQGARSRVQEGETSASSGNPAGEKR